jgi:predicted ferric reductase
LHPSSDELSVAAWQQAAARQLPSQALGPAARRRRPTEGRQELDHSRARFLRGKAGLGTVRDGSLDDEDYAAGQFKFLDSTSPVKGNRLSYATIDLGRSLWVDGATTYGLFAGYHRWTERLDAYGAIFTVDFLGVADLGDTVPTVSNDATWSALRVGATIRSVVNPKTRFSLDLAWLPYARLSNEDSHWQRSDLGPPPNVLMLVPLRRSTRHRPPPSSPQTTLQRRLGCRAGMDTAPLSERLPCASTTTAGRHTALAHHTPPRTGAIRLRMGYSFKRGVLWLAFFTVLALVPLGLARLGRLPEPRSFVVEFGVALGFLALALFALQFLFSGRIMQIAPRFGMDNIIQFHREMGLLALGLVLAHPIVLIAADRGFFAFLDPRVNFLRGVALIFVVFAAILIVVTSVWRLSFRLEYEWWRLIHGGLAFLIVFIGVVHTIQVRYYIGELWKMGALVALMAAAVYPLAHTRLVRPWLARKRPYRIVEVEPERDSSYSITLEPVGHPGIRFAPGQFAWITINDTPFTLQQHPFSFASSARNRQVRFTAKELGDFTSRWKELEPGTRAYLEGPFGSFVPDPSPETGLFLVMGGIGITPAMGMLRTLRDDGSRRPIVLIYGNVNWEDVTFREELESMKETLNLKIVHLLEEPPEDWKGESGLISREFLEKYLPADPLRYQYFICGPKPLMDITEVALRELRIPWQRIYTERFQIV